ncbi:hypothetical protein [Campylobacter showae]|jgi:hypothetical protein|uniref:Uncharacterized protein n=1 Tax=Campylobacter showae CSUNSWCD TaxID=1244083 RepID=M5IEL9_9BACT|nr:hypothetical protein [Campylobacter showae]EKU10862.1 hypothetical protein CSUNSWCD_2358 [Campylobacter showae CSUNSWCD]
MKYSQQDKARILKITTRTLQRWKTSKPELYAIIEAGFKMRELVADEEQSLSEIKKMIKEALPQS